jgi:hypothetical protein
MEITKGGDGGVNEVLSAFPTGHIVGVGHGLAAHCPDLFCHHLGGAEIRATPIYRTTEVVDDNFGSVASEAERVLSTDPTTGASNDGYSTFTQTTHLRYLIIS